MLESGAGLQLRLGARPARRLPAWRKPKNQLQSRLLSAQTEVQVDTSLAKAGAFLAACAFSFFA
jgi:hypothetical protein